MYCAPKQPIYIARLVSGIKVVWDTLQDLRMKGFVNIITTTVFKNFKIYYLCLPPKCIYKIPQER